jgi:RimJ/RimL family protein N-acetyltransferase
LRNVGMGVLRLSFCIEHVSRTTMAQASLQHAERENNAPAPSTIRLETANYVLRTLEVADITERACAWFADPTKVQMINAPARAMSFDAFKDYIESHDRVTGHALGIFEKPELRLVGIWSAYIDWELREFQLNVMVGERLSNPSGAYFETDRALQDHMFETLNLETLRCSCLARNTRMVTRMEVAGLKPERIDYAPSANREAFEAIHHYRVPKHLWRLLRDGRSTQDTIIALVNAARAGI